MFDLLRNRASLGLRFLLLVVSTVALVSIWACNKKAQPSAAQASPKTFASPDDAGKGLFEAAQSGNQETILAILAPRIRRSFTPGMQPRTKLRLTGLCAHTK